MPILLLVVSKLRSVVAPFLICKEEVLPVARERREGLARFSVAALIVTELPLAPPRVVFPLTVRLLPTVVRPEPGVRTILPDEAPPRVRVCPFVVPSVSSAVRKVLLLLPAESDAVGTPLFTLIKANLADAVALPPIRTSTVVLYGAMV